ncbi:MAG: RNA polymerase sigma factor [Spirochaetia bacterium]
MPRELEKTIQKQRTSLLGFIRKRINDSEEAEDLLQDVFLKAAEHFDSLSPITNIGAWLWQAVRNKVIDYYRQRETRRKHVMEAKAQGDEEALDLEQLLADQGFTVEQEYLRQEITEALFESLDELPEKQRDVFLLQAVEGYTFSQIAEFTGESINTLTARKRYAVQFLRKRLKDIKDVLDEIQYTNER